MLLESIPGAGKAAAWPCIPFPFTWQQGHDMSSNSDMAAQFLFFLDNCHQLTTT
jgi:hypothetical protein